MADELSGWDGKDVVELFESSLFGLGNEEEDHAEGNNVHATV